ncbi:photosystem II protein PsbQ [Synechococcus sp. B60.1]|uniref:photosystem II protein PsbQ n=1 Tax=unclassified Synechococcus TaxID=2626047 RepID=UPI0039C1BA46
MMRRWQSVLLVAILTLGLWLGSLPVQAAAALPRELQQLEQQVERLQSLVDAEDWLEIRSYIHGPMGMTRKTLNGLASTLPDKQKREMLRLAKEMGRGLEQLDFAAKAYDQPEVEVAQAKVRKTLQELKALFSQAGIPSSS